ncbi:MAG: PEP-CTERM sorting domain-containing protein [Emcibacter sp.]|nr:PEP-CTERM sorting domain-containing protein [Emcibacter sp.]
MNKNILALAVTGLLSFSTSALATPIIGQGLPTDNANLTGGTVIDFEGGASNSATLTLGNVTFSGDANIIVDGDYAGNYNTRGRYHITNYGDVPTMFRFDFATAVDAFGFLFGASDVDWYLSAYDANGLLETLTVNPVHGSNAGDYFGIAQSGMTYATLTISDYVDYVFIDNFTYATSDVPEPAPVALLGLGLLGLGLARKRRG